MIRNLQRQTICRKFSNIYKNRNASFSGMVDILESTSSSIRITAHGEDAIEVNNIYIPHPVIAFRDSYVVWNISSKADISKDSLVAVSTYFPTIEILFCGLGENAGQRLPVELIEYLRSKGTVVEVSTTFHAASTFNLLVAEGRNVAVALLPDNYE